MFRSRDSYTDAIHRNNVTDCSGITIKLIMPIIKGSALIAIVLLQILLIIVNENSLHVLIATAM